MTLQATELVRPRAAPGAVPHGYDATDYGTPARAAVPGGTPVTLSIDGRAVTVPAGTSVLRAALEAGIDIPKLCATDSLEAFGSCRVCLVEIHGKDGRRMKGYPASCTTPVEAGMQVQTSTERLLQIRRGVMELYLSDHPRDDDGLPEAPSAFRALARELGVDTVRYAARTTHLADGIDGSNPYFAYDPAKCIVCNRCVRACEETQGTFALTVQGRGFDARIVAGQDEPFMSCLLYTSDAADD